MKMSKNREQELKDFLISSRKKIGPGLTNAPVWAQQKKGERIWNNKANRHWRRTNLGDLFAKKQQEQGRIRNVAHRKSGKKKRKL